MGLGLYNLATRTSGALALPAYTRFFLAGHVGTEYGIGLREKLALMRQVKRNATRITSATAWLEQLMLVARVLSLPKSLEGDVVECGCFKGSSTASLSLACKMTGRKLTVCDSFEGLPEIAPDDVMHVSLEHRRYETYQKGEYRGALEEVQENVRRHGAIEVCSFVKGYFENTLGGLDGKYAFIFLDVDLHESLKTCLIHLWPRLEEYGLLFTHEAQQLDYVSRFFDRAWWKETFDQEPPGLIGAGSGVPIGLSRGSGLGYAVKLPKGKAVTEDPYFQHFCGDPAKAMASAGAG
jgi:O-methyltransferase